MSERRVEYQTKNSDSEKEGKLKSAILARLKSCYGIDNAISQNDLFLSINITYGEEYTTTREVRNLIVFPTRVGVILILELQMNNLPRVIFTNDNPTKQIPIDHMRLCECKPSHINCLTAKTWLKNQLGVWQFTYEARDIRNKKVHPATFPISLAKRVIELFSHEGELIVDPFVGSGTSLIAAQDLNRSAIGFDLKEEYVHLCEERLNLNAGLLNNAWQMVVHDDALNINQYIEEDSVSLFWTSPPYANLLNRKRKNKSRRDRKNDQLDQVEQYSQDPRDLGTMSIEEYTTNMGDIYEKLLPLLKPKGHCVINVPDMWWENQRITIHISLVEELRKRGYELRNIIIWDRTNIVNRIGIFGWPSNYITMGVTFEYLLDFWRPA